VAAAAHAVVDAHHRVSRPCLEQPFVAVCGWLHPLPTPVPHGPCCKFGEFLLEIFLALAEFGDLAVGPVFFASFRRDARGARLPSARLRPVPSARFPVFNLVDVALQVSIRGASAYVFLVLAGLELLVGVSAICVFLAPHRVRAACVRTRSA